MPKDARGNRQSAKKLENIYVAVDSCAELGGQPYRVIEGLIGVYSITGRRKMTLIDTEQGFHEKANGTTPETLAALKELNTYLGRFIQSNPDSVKIVQTETCRKFRQALEDKIFPDMVNPMVTATEEVSARIKENAFEILQNRGQRTLMGKPISSPDDVDLHVELFVPEGGGKSHHVFRHEVLSEAADGARDLWRMRMKEDETLSNGNRKKDEKGQIAAMVKALQETKAVAHTLLMKFNPELAEEMGDTPPELQDAGELSLATLRDASHLYENMSLPKSKALSEMPEVIQAVRLTGLWPWSRRQFLTEGAKSDLDKAHKNTADYSYLDLYANILPELSPPSDTLFILLTHDAPLREEFAQVVTGIASSEETYTTKKGKERIRDVLTETTLYEKFGLTEREPDGYPLEAPWVGSEFVEFAYKEILAALSSHTPNGEKKPLKQLREEIKVNKPGNTRDVATQLLEAIERNENIQLELKEALNYAVSQIMALEVFVNKDIVAEEVANKRGKYQDIKQDRLDQAERHGVRGR